MKVIDFQKYQLDKSFGKLKEAIINTTVLDDNILKTILAGMVDANIQMYQMHQHTEEALRNIVESGFEMVKKFNTLQEEINSLGETNTKVVNIQTQSTELVVDLQKFTESLQTRIESLEKII